PGRGARRGLPATAARRRLVREPRRSAAPCDLHVVPADPEVERGAVHRAGRPEGSGGGGVPRRPRQSSAPGVDPADAPAYRPLSRSRVGGSGEAGRPSAKARVILAGGRVRRGLVLVAAGAAVVGLSRSRLQAEGASAERHDIPFTTTVKTPHVPWATTLAGG